jgi:hypothetical protein
MAIATASAFLFFDASPGWLPVEEAAEGTVGRPRGLGLFGGGIIAGLMSLVYYDRWMGRHRQRSLLNRRPRPQSSKTLVVGAIDAGQWLALLIATGTHNFAEGLARVKAADDRLLALVIRFAAHNRGASPCRRSGASSWELPGSRRDRGARPRRDADRAVMDERVARGGVPAVAPAPSSPVVIELLELRRFEVKLVA